jgi:hypothetical protein
VTDLEKHRWQRIVEVLLLDLSTVQLPAYASWLERVERHGGLFSSLRSFTSMWAGGWRGNLFVVGGAWVVFRVHEKVMVEDGFLNSGQSCGLSSAAGP